ncbi:MAG TPA: AMP-binding protein [Burkholderiales bacterium]|nr:AMP-binding protein [Burkholderiales bacterium]
MRGVLNLAEIVAAHARLRPEKIGTRDSRRALTFAQWNKRACRLANGLLELGLEKGDRVAVLAHNRIEWMEIYVAAAKAGVVAVPVNFRLVAPEIKYIAEHCAARAFIVEDDLINSVESVRGELSIPPGNWIRLGAAPRPGWVDYEALIGAAADSEPSVEVKPADMWALMYTSGTTGRPKGAIRSHRGSALMSLVTALDMGFTVDDTALLVMPMCHANSLNFASTFTYIGATVVVDDRKSFDPEALLATMATQHVTFTSLVPTHYIMALGLPEKVKANYDVSCVRKLMISSAPARKDTKQAILSRFSPTRNSTSFTARARRVG